MRTRREYTGDLAAGIRNARFQVVGHHSKNTVYVRVADAENDLIASLDGPSMHHFLHGLATALGYRVERNHGGEP